MSTVGHALWHKAFVPFSTKHLCLGGDAGLLEMVRATDDMDTATPMLLPLLNIYFVLPRFEASSSDSEYFHIVG